MAQPIGNLLDSLGIELALDEDELVDGAIVLLKTVDTDGDVGLRPLVLRHGLPRADRDAGRGAADRDRRTA